MDRSKLIDNLDKATDKAASNAIESGFPIHNTTSSAWVGKTFIKKNRNGFYDIFSLDKKVLFKDITVFDVATIIAQRYTSGELRTVERVVKLESEYSTYRTNMMHYLHCIQGAKSRKDYDTMAILEDKFQMAEIRAKRIRNDIAIFKRLK
jgi:hypothetical protein